MLLSTYTEKLYISTQNETNLKYWYSYKVYRIDGSTYLPN